MSSSSLFLYNEGSVNQDVWNHLVFIVDQSNSQIKVYQNGELIDTRSDVHIDIPNYFKKMQIGKNVYCIHLIFFLLFLIMHL